MTAQPGGMRATPRTDEAELGCWEDARGYVSAAFARELESEIDGTQKILINRQSELIAANTEISVLRARARRMEVALRLIADKAKKMHNDIAAIANAAL